MLFLLLGNFFRSLLRRGFLLRRRLLRLWLRLVRFRSGHFHLLRLGFLLRQFGSFEALSVESDLRNPHRGKRLPMPTQLLVLLLAFVMEDEDLRGAAFSDHFADHPGIGLIADLAFFARNGDHGELHLPVGAGAQFLHSNYIARRHPVLLPTGADNRVHTSASIECLYYSAPKPEL